MCLLQLKIEGRNIEKDNYQKSCNFLNDRPRPISRKIREDGVKNYPSMSDKGASLDDSAVRKPIFSSEAGAVLTFFDYFFVSRQKRNWGYTDWKNIINQLSLCSFVINILIIGINDCKFTKQFGLFCKHNSYNRDNTPFRQSHGMTKLPCNAAPEIVASIQLYRTICLANNNISVLRTSDFFCYFISTIISRRCRFR